MKARELLRTNIDRLLLGQPRARLTEGLGRPSSWISQILSDGEHSRGLFLDRIDEIAGFFRVPAEELFKEPWRFSSHIDKTVEFRKTTPSTPHQSATEGAPMHEDPGPRGDPRREAVLDLYDYLTRRVGGDPVVLDGLIDDIETLIRKRLDEHRSQKQRGLEAAKK